MSIQLPPVHTTLIETHEELAKVTHNITEICKRTEKASEKLHKEWSTTLKANEELASPLQEAKTKLK